MKKYSFYGMMLLGVTALLSSCGNQGDGKSSSNGALSSSAAEKAYVAPGEHDEFYGQYSIKNALNQQTHAIIDFYSVDRRTQPHTKMIDKYQAVKKVVFRLKSNTSTTLKITDLKVMAQPMSVPLF